jgi:hypothetical protein
MQHRSLEPWSERRRSAVPASPDVIRQVRGRLVWLQALGMSERAIARQAGVHPTTVHRARTGGIVKLSREVAAALMAVKVDPR